MDRVGAQVDEKLEAGARYELIQRGADWDIFVDGRLSMSSGGPRLETAIADLALTPWGTRDDLTVLLAGLGLGLLLRALLDHAQVKHVDVVEHSSTITEWARGPLASLNGGALEDKRVTLIARELFAYLRDPDPATGSRPTGYSFLIL